MSHATISYASIYRQPVASTSATGSAFTTKVKAELLRILAQMASRR